MEEAIRAGRRAASRQPFRLLVPITSVRRRALRGKLQHTRSAQGTGLRGKREQSSREERRGENSGIKWHEGRGVNAAAAAAPY